MKALASLKLLSVAILFALIIPVHAQENDDMYFNHSDRKPGKSNTDLLAKNTEDNKQETIKNTDQYGTIQDNYSSKNVNPEYIARYRNSKDASIDSNAEGGSYYEENYNRDNPNAYAKQGGITNNYYNYPSAFYNGFGPMYRNNMYNSMMWDPMWGPSAMVPGWSFGMGYRFGYMPGWSFNLSYGNNWGYSPFGYSPMNYGYNNPWAYDSWGYPYSSYGGMGYGSMYYPSYYYGSGFGNMYYGSVFNCWSCYYNNYSTSTSDKNVTNGRRSFRSSTVVTGPQLNNQGRTSRTSANRQSMPKSGDGNISQNRTRVSSQRDYSAGQNEYYSRSRNAYNPVNTSNSYSRGGRSGYSGSSTNGYNTGSVSRGYARTSSGSNDYSRPTYRSSTYNNSNNHNRSSNSKPSSNSWSNGSSSGSFERSSRSYSSGSSNSGSSFSSGSGSRSYSSGSSGGGSSSGSSGSRGGRGH